MTCGVGEVDGRSAMNADGCKRGASYSFYFFEWTSSHISDCLFQVNNGHVTRNPSPCHGPEFKHPPVYHAREALLVDEQLPLPFPYKPLYLLRPHGPQERQTGTTASTQQTSQANRTRCRNRKARAQAPLGVAVQCWAGVHNMTTWKRRWREASSISGIASSPLPSSIVHPSPSLPSHAIQLLDNNNMARLRALDLEEIRARVAIHLHKRDLLRCVLVCSEWRSSFTPFLYRTITYGTQPDKDPAPSLFSLLHFRHHIQQFEFSSFPYEVLASLRGCTKLESLAYRQAYFLLEPRSMQDPTTLSLLEQTLLERWSPEQLESNRFKEWQAFQLDNERRQLLSIFLGSHGSTLRTIHLSEFDPNPTTELWEAIADTCSNLETLRLSEINIPRDSFGAFVQACSRAQEVIMRAVQLPRDLSPLNYPPSQWLPRMLQRHLKESGHTPSRPTLNPSVVSLWSKTRRLRVYGMHSFSVDSMTLFTGLFPNLEDLSWWDTRVPVNHPRLLCVVASQGVWPQLNSLELQSRGLEDEDLAMLIGTMTRIERIYLEESGFGAQCFQALMLRDSLVFEGLRELKLGKSENLTGAMACRILEKCSKLEQFTTLAAITFEDLLGHNQPENELRLWACLGLRTLTIDFDLDIPEIIRNDKPVESGTTSIKDTIIARSKMMRLIRRGSSFTEKTLSDYSLKDRCRIAFGQLARLTRLESLTISGLDRDKDAVLPQARQRDLQFNLGYGLSTLSRLKQLQKVDLAKSEQHMSEKDIDWMLDNWPLLRYLDGRLNPVQAIHDDLLATLRNRKESVGH